MKKLHSFNIHDAAGGYKWGNFFVLSIMSQSISEDCDKLLSMVHSIFTTTVHYNHTTTITRLLRTICYVHRSTYIFKGKNEKSIFSILCLIGSHRDQAI